MLTIPKYYSGVLSAVLILLSSCSMSDRKEESVVPCLYGRITATCVDTSQRQIDIGECLAGVDSVVVFGYRAIRETVHDHTGLWLDDVSDYGAPVIVYYSNGCAAVEYVPSGVSEVEDGEIIFLHATLQDPEINPRPVVIRASSSVVGALRKNGGIEYYRVSVR